MPRKNRSVDSNHESRPLAQAQDSGWNARARRVQARDGRRGARHVEGDCRREWWPAETTAPPPGPARQAAAAEAAGAAYSVRQTEADPFTAGCRPLVHADIS